jgi:hypothetical protein
MGNEVDEKVWGLTKRQAIVLLGLCACVSGPPGFLLLILWWLEYDKRSKRN